VKIAFVGKGGSGKTTTSALVARHLAARNRPVLAVDADINQHLGVALGLDEDAAATLRPLGQHLTEIKDHLRGTNPRIASAGEMVKTTPPGRGSRLLQPSVPDPLWDRFAHPVGDLRLLVTGPFDEADLGVACYHSKVGAVELLLNHLLDGPGEYVVVDMTAGADSFASGLFTRFDRTFLVAEPTRKGVAVWRQYREYARDHDVAVSVVGNKVAGPEDVAFLREHVGDDLLCVLPQSRAVQAMERGEPLALDALEPEIVAGLDRIVEAVDGTGQDWVRFSRQAVDFHLRNAKAWANDATGADLGRQVDPEFTLGPHLPGLS
jgi:CO dehydrogenase maturation factor